MTGINDVLVWTAIGIGTVAIGVGVITVVAAGWYHYRDRRRETVRNRMRSALFERLFAEDPDWPGWVEDLSRAERRQLERLLDEYLRQLRGTEHDRLRDLAAALGVPERAKRNLAAGRERFRALAWLALLSEPIDPDRLEAACGDDPQLRAGAARILHNSGHPEAPEIGTAFVVGDGDRSLTAFGMDTLYRLNNGAGTPLLSMIAEGIETWNTRLLVQTLLVLRHCDISDPAGRFGWLPNALEHESPRVRGATVGVLERHGWHEKIQATVDIETLLDDPEATVREDAYLMLASWNTEKSARWLRRALARADHEEGLALARALLVHSRTDVSGGPGWFEPFREWAQADAAVGRQRRVWGVSAAWA